MTDEPAAFLATYADWKLIKTRSVIQIVFEVPIADHDAAYKALGGMPDPGAERWFGIGRYKPPSGKEGNNSTPTKALDAKPAPAVHMPPDTPQPGRESSLPQRAAIMCGEPIFWKYLEENCCTYSVKSADEARDSMYALLDIRSRREIQPGTEIGEKFDRLHSKYIAWKLVPA